MKIRDIFCDNMMLQRGSETIIYGEGDGNGYVEITFSHAKGMWLDNTWFEDLYIFDETGMHYEVNGRTADFKIDGDKLLVTWDKVINPIGIKMGYWNIPKHKLKNDSGYLASPFKMLF